MMRTMMCMMRVLIVAAIIGIFGICQSEISAEELKITGSTTFAPLVAALSESFMAKNPTVKITFSQSNAAESINSVMVGDADVGCSARYVSSKESDMAVAKGISLACHTVALDCVFPIVHPSNNIKSLGLLQINSIFKGSVKNWNDFDGGANANIKLVTRESGSAMYEFWQDKIMHNDVISPGSITLRSNQDVVNMVSSDPSAIGYTSFNYLDEKVKIVPLNGLETFSTPSANHPLSRKLIMCTKGGHTNIVDRFIDFVNGPEGKSLVQKAKYIPL